MIDSTSVMDDPPVRLILLLTTVLCSHAGDIRAADALVEKTWSVDGETRKALLHVPTPSQKTFPFRIFSCPHSKRAIVPPSAFPFSPRESRPPTGEPWLFGRAGNLMTHDTAARVSLPR